MCLFVGKFTNLLLFWKRKIWFIVWNRTSDQYQDLDSQFIGFCKFLSNGWVSPWNINVLWEKHMLHRLQYKIYEQIFFFFIRTGKAKIIISHRIYHKSVSKPKNLIISKVFNVYSIRPCIIFLNIVIFPQI